MHDLRYIVLEEGCSATKQRKAACLAVGLLWASFKLRALLAVWATLAGALAALALHFLHLLARANLPRVRASILAPLGIAQPEM